MKRNAILIVLAVLGVVAMVALRTPSPAPKEAHVESRSHGHAHSVAADHALSSADGPGAPSEPATEPVAADPEFQNWLKEEAKSIDYPSVDGARKESELRAVAAKLTPSQSEQLLRTARNPRAPAGEKILSTYMLVEGGRLSRAALVDLIKSPLSVPEHPETHSEDEITGVREKSLRIMAVDGLLSAAQKDPSARAALVKEIAHIQDPYVRGYAQRRLDELDRSSQ